MSRIQKEGGSPRTTALQIARRPLRNWAAAAWAGWEASDDRCDESSAHGGDRVWDVPFRPQGGILGVGNCRVRQVAGAAWRNEVLRGGSVSLSEIRNPSAAMPMVPCWRKPRHPRPS